jgi:hypothetical protein
MAKIMAGGILAASIINGNGEIISYQVNNQWPIISVMAASMAVINGVMASKA